MRTSHLHAATLAAQKHYGAAVTLTAALVREEVLNAARKAEAGSACDKGEALRVALEVATGLTIANLAREAYGHWPIARRADAPQEVGDGYPGTRWTCSACGALSSIGDKPVRNACTCVERGD